MPSSSERSTLSLPDALPISLSLGERVGVQLERVEAVLERVLDADGVPRQLAGLARRHERAAEPVRERAAEDEAARLGAEDHVRDRKSTRLNSSHVSISYAVFLRALHSFPTRRSSDLAVPWRTRRRAARARRSRTRART